MGGGQLCCGRQRSEQPFFLGIAEQGDAAIRVQLFVDIVQVNLDRALADGQLVGNLLVAQAASHHAHDGASGHSHLFERNQFGSFSAGYKSLL